MRCERIHTSGWLVCALLTLAWPAAGWAGEPGYAGRPVVDVLRELRGPGLEFIYSSGLLPPSLRVLADPPSRDRLALAAEILAPHDLGLTAVRPGLFAVTRLRHPAEVGAVSGRVTDADDGRPVPGARVEFRPVGAVAWSGSDGAFAVDAVPAGQYSLRIQAPGYQALDLDSTVSASAPQQLDVRLQAAPIALGEIVVSTSRYALIDEPSASMLLRGSDIAAQAGLGGDAIRSLARLPGIAQSGLSAQSNVRGGEAGDVLILLDGFELREAFHLTGYQSPVGILDPGLIRQAEVFTGGFPARYGNRLAGVFDLQTIAATDEPRRAMGLSLINAWAHHGGSLDAVDSRWLVGGRAGVLRPVLQALAPTAGNPTFGDIYGRIEHGDPDSLLISGNVLWTHDELDISRPNIGERAMVESDTRYLWLRAEHRWGTDLEGSLWVGHSSIGSNRTGSVDNPAISVGSLADDRRSSYRDVRGEMNWQATDRHHLQAGLAWSGENGRYRYASQAVFPDPVADLFGRQGTVARNLDLHRSRNRIAAFASHRWRLTEVLVSELGLRVQRTVTPGLDNEWLQDPRVSLRWQVTPTTDLRLHWGRFHQTDEVHELKVEDGLTSFPAAQRADHLIAGLEHHYVNGLSVRVEAFRKQQANPRPRFENVLTRLSIVPDLAPDRVMLAPDAAEVHGIELTASLEGSRGRYWASLAWSDSLDVFGDVEIARSWDQTWSASAGIDWSYGPWRVSGIAAGHTGWPTTRLADGILGPRNATRLPYYASVDLRAEYHRPLSLGSLTLAVGVANSMNRNNICCSDLTQVAAPDGAAMLGTRPRSWLPLVPSLSVLWEF